VAAWLRGCVAAWLRGCVAAWLNSVSAMKNRDRRSEDGVVVILSAGKLMC
jgi:hypothetical protein